MVIASSEKKGGRFPRQLCMNEFQDCLEKGETENLYTFPSNANIHVYHCAQTAYSSTYLSLDLKIIPYIHLLSMNNISKRTKKPTQLITASPNCCIVY